MTTEIDDLFAAALEVQAKAHAPYSNFRVGAAVRSASGRIFAGCNNTSVVVDPNTGKVVATIKNGTRVDALGWDSSKKLIYIPNGGEGNVTVVHQDSPDKYTVVATVDTFAGAKTITVDPKTHNAYLWVANS